jgi:hypothetical protein
MNASTTHHTHESPTRISQRTPQPHITHESPTRINQRTPQPHITHTNLRRGLVKEHLDHTSHTCFFLRVHSEGVEGTGGLCLDVERTVGHIYPAATGADPKIPRFKPAYFPLHSRDIHAFHLYLSGRTWINAIERGWYHHVSFASERRCTVLNSSLSMV